jgi:hypothetical protein
MNEQHQSIFEIEQATWSRAPGVIVRGDVDIVTAAQLTASLDAPIRDSVGAFVVDLCDVEFLDSSGLHALMRARAVLGRDDRPSSARPPRFGASSRSPVWLTCSQCSTRARRRRERLRPRHDRAHRPLVHPRSARRPGPPED